MIERLGKALYWASIVIAALILTMTAYVASGVMTWQDAWLYIVIGVVAAGLCVGIGRAAQYVLAGR
jgi:hypothetical protein